MRLPVDKNRTIITSLMCVLTVTPMLVVGINIRSAEYTIAAILFSIAVGIAEEVYFRGVILRILNEAFRSGAALVMSAVIYALSNFVSIINVKSISGIILQVLSALVFGIIAAQIVYLTKSIVITIAWHVLFCFAGKITMAEGFVKSTANIIQIAIMFFMMAALYLVISKKKIVFL